MGRRKGLDDRIVDTIRAISSPWLGSPPAQNKEATKFQGLVRGAAETLDQTVTGGMIKAGTQGNQALAKQAAINAAALATGYIAGKAVQKVAPLIRNRLGREIGVHLSDVDKLKKITWSETRAGKGNLPYEIEVERGATYKFAPYRDVEYNYNSAGYITGKPTRIVDRMDTKRFAESVAENNQQMSAVTGNPTKPFAYITKSKAGLRDEDWLSTNAYTVEKQKVIQKVELPQTIIDDEPLDGWGNYKGGWPAEFAVNDNYDKVSNIVFDALKKQENLTQSNLQQTINFARGVSAVATQQALNKKKGRGGGAKKR